ncbi:bifunctional DNA-formamidopyrimidine glycosylase/DNA-(apurinic or apyrimidinic site) lyase [Dielma fastidiosa]|uniref:Formamidopyrimidine-DNA glycosylase n=1 Tax=Dielma fastidiosa TaxID=1034346 RepID=A0A318L792_9FIRM|nr:bifunctional DNA-formamidopyrimidine glycosylase/DNA-(apurinic or apyrimidinic site) lyase [Dielma fastidiosa]PXX77547.1 DNA-(apurinic or apyrimidinic site) lyase [Dielma fastidiosa]
MPELPEVETVRATLEVQLGHPKIVGVDVYWENILPQGSDFFKQKIIGQSIQAYKRRGKYLMFVLDEDMLIAHLRMEGKFYIYDQPTMRNKHTHVVFHLDDGRELHYNDTRKFGRMEIYPLAEDENYPMLKNTGLDAFDERLDALALYKKWHPKKMPLKAMLLDQTFLAGIGNIYADEICFACGLHPKTPVSHCSKKDFENILFHTRRILAGAVKAGGTTIRSYTSSLGVTGLFQLKLKVHARENQPCLICQTPIKKIKVIGRGTCLCPKCQKRK